MIVRLLLLLLLACVALVVARMAHQPGTLTLDWLGWQISVHPLWGLGALLLVLGALTMLQHLYIALRYRSGLFGSGRSLRRTRKAQRLAAQGFAEQQLLQSRLASRHARQALALTPDDPLALYLAAQGGDADAQNRLESHKQTALLGALAAHAHAPSPLTAERLATLAPASAASQAAVLAARARIGDWEGALKALTRWAKLDPTLSPPPAQQRAALTLAASHAAEAQTLPDAALRWAEQAHKADPGFAPAAAQVARLWTRANKRPKALAALHAAWAHTPHPLLAHALLALDPLLTATDHLAAIETLVATAPHHRESHLHLASALLTVGDAPAALEQLEPLLQHEPSARTAHLALAAYRQMGLEPDTDAPWYSALLNGSPEPDWRCTACGGHQPQWSLFCRSCNTPARLTWTGESQGDHP